MHCPIEPRQDIVENSEKASIADMVLALHEATGGAFVWIKLQTRCSLSFYLRFLQAEKTLVGGATSKIDSSSLVVSSIYPSRSDLCLQSAVVK